MEVGNLSVKIDFDLSDLKQGLKSIEISSGLAAHVMTSSFSSVGKSLHDHLTTPAIKAAGQMGSTFLKAGNVLSSSFASPASKTKTMLNKMASDIVKAMSKAIIAFDKSSDSFKKMAQIAEKSFDNINKTLSDYIESNSNIAASSIQVIDSIVNISSALKVLQKEQIVQIETKAKSMLVDLNCIPISSAKAGAYTVEGIAAKGAAMAVKQLAVATAAALGIFVLIAGAVAAVVAVYNVATKSSRELKKETKELAEAIQSARDAAIEETEAIIANNERIYSTIDKLLRWIDAYNEYDNVGAEIFDDIAVAILVLNDAISGLNLVFNETTGRMSMQASELQALYREWSKTELVNNAIKTQERATKNIASLTAQMSKLSKKYGNDITELIAAGYGDLKEQLDATVLELENVNKTLEENIGSLKNYGGVILDIIDLKELEAKAIKRIQDDRELSVQEHLDEIARLENSAEADREEKIIEHYKSIHEIEKEEQEKIEEASREHQEQLEESRREHVDRMLGFDKKGAYGRGKTFSAQLKAAEEYDNDMKLWQANLEELTKKGFGELAEIYRSGGVEMGGELANVVKELQDKGPEGLKDFNDLMTGAASGAFDETIAEYDKVPDAVSEVIGDETEESSETAIAAYDLGVMLPEKLNEGLASQNEFIVTTMSDIGKLYIDGLIIGLEENQQRAINKANEIASQITKTFEEAWEEHSPSKVGERLTGNFIKGLEIGMDSKNLLNRSAQIAGGIVDSVYSSLYENNNVTNNYNNQRSVTTSVNVQSGQDKIEVERMWRKLVRQQAVAIAR